jgi:hypothetical protein
MKTTHEIARELLALPDVPLFIDGWFYHWADREMVAEMTKNPKGTAIIWQKPNNTVGDHEKQAHKHVP